MESVAASSSSASIINLTLAALPVESLVDTPTSVVVSEPPSPPPRAMRLVSLNSSAFTRPPLPSPAFPQSRRARLIWDVPC
ncbi:hypothetical protein BD309DRAFT_964057 [Dichomitus squalens]|nr:hypothetical protein BD309DRAFT_964057 [Dichomitus squalens]